MLTIAIDASTHSTGIALFSDKKLIQYKLIENASKDVLFRIKYMTDAIENIYKTLGNQSVQVILEDVLPDNLSTDNQKWMRNKNTFKPLMYLQAAIVLMFNQHNVPVELVGASTWRRKCGIKQGGATRDMLKMRDVAFVRDNYEINVNDDVADAICIGHSKVNEVPEPEPFNWE